MARLRPDPRYIELQQTVFKQLIRVYLLASNSGLSEIWVTMTTHDSKRRKVDFLSCVNKRFPTSNPSSASGSSDGGSENKGGYEEPLPSTKTRGPKIPNRYIPGPVQSIPASLGLFKIRLDELFMHVKSNYEKRMPKVDQILYKLKCIIENIPACHATSYAEVEQLQRSAHQVRTPFPHPLPRDANYNFSYMKPANINVVGSYARKTIIQTEGQLLIDLAVTMPSQIFQGKDYLNFQYFHKRAFYLACIAAGIDEVSNGRFHLEFAYQNDNALQPAIIVTPSPDGGEGDFRMSKCQIRILLAADAALFPMSKMLLDENYSRPKNTMMEDQTSMRELTPFYNATLQSECNTLAYLKFLHSASIRSEAFNNACILGSTWLRQRGFGAGLANGGFGPFEWACIMALLMQGAKHNGKPVLSRGHSSFQLFKAVLQYLSTKDLIHAPECINSEQLYVATSPGPIFYDDVRGMNVLFKMTPWSYNVLRHEANMTLVSLNDKLVDHFDACFVTKIDDPVQKYDCLVRLPIKDFKLQSSVGDDMRCQAASFSHYLYLVLLRGLGNRARLIHLQCPQTRPWGLADLAEQPLEAREILVGLLLNPENVNRAVEKGPLAEEKEAAVKFRRFWGEKAELRRFRDGSILESLVWSSSDAAHCVLQQILTYLIRRHFGAETARSLEIKAGISNDLAPDECLAVLVDHSVHYGALFNAFDVLEKQLRILEGLPLKIRQVSASDPQLCCTSLRPPILDSTHRSMRPADVHIQFEGSNRWPEDFAAAQRTKIAFLLKIGELLEASTPDLKTRLGVENASKDLANITFLDVFYPSSASFRIRIHHEREESMIERVLKTTAKSNDDKEIAASALSAYKRTFLQAPLHTSSLQILSTRFPTLTSSVRLLKRWRDCHLLSDHIGDELIELLTLRTFVHPGPYDVPGSTMTGFLRTLLFISKWDWRFEPLIVDLNGEMSIGDIEAIKRHFEAWRKIDPAMTKIVLFAASNNARDGVSYTEQGPSKVIAAHFTSLAKASIKLVQQQGFDFQLNALFRPVLTDYDFLIHLDTNMCYDRQKQEAKQSVFKNLRVDQRVDAALVGFDPVRSFLKELRYLYSSNVVFFHDADGGNVVGGLWNPQTGPRQWRISLGYSSTPTKGKTDEDAIVDINKAGTLNDIARLGGDLVKRVDALSL